MSRQQDGRPAKVLEILKGYSGDNPGTLCNISRLLMAGSLGGTGKVVILPVDQGFEHGPVQSFAINPPAYDPVYHVELAIKAGLSAYAAPLGMLESVASDYAGCIPLILKLNSANSLAPNTDPDQATTATCEDALRLGCVGVGFTIYPGSMYCNEMIEKAADVIAEAKSVGLFSLIWAYPRGSELPKEAESALDVVSYAAHIAALIGAHVIKVKLPSQTIFRKEASKHYHLDALRSLKERISYVMQSAFNSKRITLFSGGSAKDLNTLYSEVSAIKEAGGYGSIIGRNVFQRPEEEALEMLKEVLRLYVDG